MICQPHSRYSVLHLNVQSQLFREMIVTSDLPPFGQLQSRNVTADEVAPIVRMSHPAGIALPALATRVLNLYSLNAKYSVCHQEYNLHMKCTFLMQEIRFSLLERSKLAGIQLLVHSESN